METKQKKTMVVKLTRLLNYLRRFLYWLFWLGAFYVLSSISSIVTILYLAKILNFSPNLIASLFSMLGLVIILIQQILDAIDFADHKPNTFINWVKSVPTLKPKVVTIGIALEFSSALKVRAEVGLRPDAIIEEKINFLMRQIKELQNSLNNLDDKLDKVDDAVNKKIESLKNDMKQVDTTLNKKLAEHVIGLYDANISGVIITICGVVIQAFRG